MKKPPPPTDDAVALECGRRLKAARAARGWTAQDLADATGLGVSRIGNYEQGTRRFDQEEAEAFALALGLPAAYWLGLVNETEARVLASLRNSESSGITGHHSQKDIARAMERMKNKRGKGHGQKN